MTSLDSGVSALEVSFALLPEKGAPVAEAAPLTRPADLPTVRSRSASAVDDAYAQPRSVGFLLNHDHIHQVAHSAGIGFELSRSFPAIRVTFIVSCAAQLQQLMVIGRRFRGHRCEFHLLDDRGFWAWLARFLDPVAPFQKVWLLKRNLEFFRPFDALVVPEKTSLMLRSRFGLDHLKMIHTRHGAGDRAVGFNRDSGQFDFILVAGTKIKQRLEDTGALSTARFAIVGYPKFDAVGAIDDTPPKLFDNNRTTVLYNPHCAPHLSSWYRMGREIMEFFYQSKNFNLIVAPHVMLYRRRLQITLDHLSFAWAKGIPRRYRECPHMLIDTGSAASTDMTYTKAADIYLGDVSSQICEFMIRPRPCLFVNAHGIDWRNDPSYAAWKLGPVVESVADLDRSLRKAILEQPQNLPLQQRYIEDTFDLTDEPSSLRAATAIVEFLNSETTV